MSEARGGDPPTTKLKHKFKANHSSNVDAPREDSVPLPPFGWKTVNRKTRENDQDRNKTGKLEKKRFPLRLVERDWSIKVLPFLGNQNLKLVLITPNKLTKKSKKFACRCIAVNDRLTKVTRWYTNLRSVIVPLALVEMGSDAPKMNLTNTTVKMVVQGVKMYRTTSEQQAANYESRTGDSFPEG